MWHVTCVTWHVTRDTWNVTWCGGRTFSQNVSSLALTVCDLWYLKDLEEIADSLTESINYKGVCGTAPATPGLLKKDIISKNYIFHTFLCKSRDIYLHEVGRKVLVISSWDFLFWTKCHFQLCIICVGLFGFKK